ILLGDGLGGFSQAADVQVGSGTLSVAVGDFNADTALDLAVAKNTDCGCTARDSVSVLLGNGLGGFFRAVDVQVGEFAPSVAVGDFNADGALDLAVANLYSYTVSILTNQLASRADLNGSNRIDGFDVAAISRLAGATRCPFDNLGCTSAY